MLQLFVFKLLLVGNQLKSFCFVLCKDLNICLLGRCFFT